MHRWFVPGCLLLALISCQVLPSLQPNRPNFILILTDDLDDSLMPYLANTNALIADQGVRFTNYFITTPMCCPSRTSMLTGRYAHNTDILDNFPAFKRFFQRGEEAETLAVWLKRAGYETAMIGKYLNLYPIDAGRNYVPPGWTDWHAFLYEKSGDNFYFDYKMNENGEVVTYGNAAAEYSTDVIRALSLRFITQNASRGTPFFLLASVYAPHGPGTPAPRHADLFTDLEYPKGPSFNEADITDKPAILQTLVQSGDEFDPGDADNFFRGRARSVQAVDEMVAEVIDLLEKTGQLENTYILFTSDNGFRNGEHRLATGKGLPYEEDIRVPLLMRGPGIGPNTSISLMTTNIDLAPTIAELAGARTADFVDGRSMTPLLDPSPQQSLEWRNGVLIEAGYWDPPASFAVHAASYTGTSQQADVFQYLEAMEDESLRQIGGVAYRGFRTEGFKYVEYINGEIELYDLQNDPFELENLSDRTDPAVLSRLHDWVDRLAGCTSGECRTIESQLPQGIPN
jgi:arylsulfatase A-like enzyme